MIDSPPSPALARLFDLLELLSLRRLRERELPRSLTGAAFRGDLAMVEVFLAKGAADRDEAIRWAMRSGQKEIITRLLEAGGKPDSKGAAAAAAERNRIDLLEILFRAGLDPASREAQHAMVSAAIAGKASTMRFLLARGVIVNANDVRFASMIAERNGHAEVTAFLDEKRKDLDGVADAADPPPIVVFHPAGRVEDDWSEERIEAEALSIVRSGSVDREIDRTNRHELSVLGAAIDADAIAFAEAALDHHANPAGSETERAPIVCAASHGLTSLVARLAPLVPQPQRDAALEEAASFGLPAVVETLLQEGADPSSAEGVSSLAKAAGPYRDEIRTLLRRALRERGVKQGPALGVEGKKPRKRVATLRGIHEFVKPLVDTNPDWTILALRKPIEEVTPQLATLYGASRAELDVASRGVEHVTIGVFVVQLTDAWTIELRSLGFHHRGRWELDSKQAALISKELACEAIYCHGSDASGTFSVTRCDRGERVEQVEWTFDRLAAADAYFTSFELFVPGCRVDSFGLSPRLDLLRIDPSAVKRLDFLVLEE